MTHFTAFHFCEGSSPSSKTHVLGWDGSRWVVPCDTLTEPRAPTYTKPYYKLCERLTSQIHPYPARRQWDAPWRLRSRD